MARICIDGFNLTLPAGSGIATYARNLNAIIGSLGHETQILVSAPRKLGSNNFLNQIALVDFQPVKGYAARSRGFRRMIPRFRPHAKEIVMTDDVIATGLAHHFPPGARFWASPDIFHSANVAYGMFRRLTPLRLGTAVETDIMHWTAPLPIVEPRVANVYTLHDLIPLRLPFTTLDNKRAFYDLCTTLVARADRIFTVSEHSRADIVRLLGADENRVINTYQAVDVPAHLRDRPSDAIARELEGVFGLQPRGYFLYFGALEPKKNLRRIVDAYLSSAVKTPLVVVGRPWPSNPWLQGEAPDIQVIPEPLTSTVPILRQGQFLDQRGIPDRLILLSDRILRYNHLPFASLVTLIQGARATLFPSLYEGFGLPVLETMQLGTPVLTSTAGSLPEVAGDAAILVDPYDTDAIRSGIQALDADEDLRRALIEKGRQRASLFTTERYRQRLQDAYAPLL